LREPPIESPDDGPKEDLVGAKRMEFAPDAENQMMAVAQRFGAGIGVATKEEYETYQKYDMPLRGVCRFEGPSWTMTAAPPGQKLLLSSGSYTLLINHAEHNSFLRGLIQQSGVPPSNARLFLLFPQKPDGFPAKLVAAIHDGIVKKSHIADEALLPDWRYVKLQWNNGEDAGVSVLDLQFASKSQ
jgi:hypothetical protein